ncbi:MAG: bifunctional diaminohydroxyphosphoribosylaminopyrimidine deaminase/5-amino-6-(5-phosphoribosylamino)uracil reductase RibD [Pseudomonadota bacterium]
MGGENTQAVDHHFMAMALSLGRRGQGRTWPNPAVGCVIVQDKIVVGQGWTQPGGRPHAETEALKQAGDRAAGATAYVTLEPCAHHGKTPPCSDALIKAGISRVVMACQDPDPRVDGRGIATLQAAGIDLTIGVGEAAAMADLNGFMMSRQEGRPAFTWKVASSLDARIALGNGDSQWITGETARRLGHGLRVTHDAILIGRGTALTDNPLLNTRLPGCSERSPVRVVLDTYVKTPLTSQLAQTAKDIPLWLVCQDQAAEASRIEAWQATGADVLALADMAPLTIAQALGARGVTTVLIEGGAQVAGSFMKTGLIDRVEWFRGGQVLGGDGLPALGDQALAQLSDARQYRCESIRPLGSDRWERYVAV